jgi:hypothetical protein
VWEARRFGSDARVDVLVTPTAERYIGNLCVTVESGVGGDPKGDSQRFFSARWGNGHEGAGVEILDVAFVKVRCVIFATEGMDNKNLGIYGLHRVAEHIVCLVSVARIASRALVSML